MLQVSNALCHCAFIVVQHYLIPHACFFGSVQLTFKYRSTFCHNNFHVLLK